MNKTKWGFVGLFALLLFVTGFMLFKNSTSDKMKDLQPTSVSSNGSMVAAPLPGYMAPDFTLQDLNGNRVTLSQLRGKPLLLNFWASWCPPCRQEMPDLAKKAEAYKGKVQFY